MPLRRRFLVPVLAALVAGLGAPGAGAQSIPSPEELPPVSERPQVEEPPAEEPPAEEPPAEEPASEEPAPDEPARAPEPSEASELPDTGSDARVVVLLGATVLLTGIGLRLRTAPELF